jgi:hypothetical protein
MQPRPQRGLPADSRIARHGPGWPEDPPPWSTEDLSAQPPVPAPSRTPQPPPDAKRTTHQLPVVKKMAPGQPGTKRWSTEFGEALVCVRYRHDLANGERIVTVELATHRAALRTRAKDTDEVAVRIGWEETALRILARDQGALWDRRQRVWRMTRAQAKQLRLIDRIVEATE